MEMAFWVKHVPHKQEELNSDNQSPLILNVKQSMVAHTVTLALGWEWSGPQGLTD